MFTLNYKNSGNNTLLEHKTLLWLHKAAFEREGQRKGLPRQLGTLGQRTWDAHWGWIFSHKHQG